MVAGLKTAGRSNAHKYWVGMFFNADEDLILLNAEGRLYLFDIVLGSLKEETSFKNFPVNFTMPEGNQHFVPPACIVDSRFDQANNVLAFRNERAQFYYMENVKSGTINKGSPMQFVGIAKLESSIKKTDKLNFLLVSRQ